MFHRLGYYLLVTSPFSLVNSGRPQRNAPSLRRRLAPGHLEEMVHWPEPRLLRAGRQPQNQLSCGGVTPKRLFWLFWRWVCVCTRLSDKPKYRDILCEQKSGLQPSDMRFSCRRWEEKEVIRHIDGKFEHSQAHSRTSRQQTSVPFGYLI